jgi:hypothetical protein
LQQFDNECETSVSIAELKGVNMPRNRLIYAGFSALALVCGLATRPLRSVIGPDLAENLGDALWAVLVYLLIAWTWRRQSNWRIAVTTLAVSVAVEFSQMYHTPWLDAIRRTTLGGLVLGLGVRVGRSHRVCGRHRWMFHAGAAFQTQARRDGVGL